MKSKYFHKTSVRITMLVLCFTSTYFLVATAKAAQFRSFVPIVTSDPAPKGSVVVSRPKPLYASLIAQALQRLFDSWSNDELRQHLSEKFYDRSRLLDVIARDVPRDARLRVLSIQNGQLLQQFSGAQRGVYQQPQSTVSVVARVQLEWNDPAQGFQRLEGVSEYVLLLTTLSENKGEE